MGNTPAPTPDFVRLWSGQDLLKFVTSTTVAVIHVQTQPLEFGNVALAQALGKLPGIGIRFAQIHRDALDTSNGYFQLIAGEQLRKLDLPADHLLPGYYLIFNQELLGWHPCALPQQKRDLAVIVSGVYGLAKFFASENPLAGLLDGFQYYQQISSQEAFYFFKHLLESNTRSGATGKQARAEQQRVFKSKLLGAYDLLGVSEGASLEAVKRAYRAKVRDFHPDGAVTEDDRMMRTKAMTDLNLARELIESLHSSTPKDATVHENG